jgi:tRNA(fMet)-specific endonuclease VapC
MPVELCAETATPDSVWRCRSCTRPDAKASRALHRLIDTFSRSVAVSSFDQAAADRFGTVAAALAKRGEPIGTFDTLIAAHALACGLTLVTNNTKHFQRVAGLKLANWA